MILNSIFVLLYSSIVDYLINEPLIYPIIFNNVKQRVQRKIKRRRKRHKNWSYNNGNGKKGRKRDAIMYFDWLHDKPWLVVAFSQPAMRLAILPMSGCPLSADACLEIPSRSQYIRTTHSSVRFIDGGKTGPPFVRHKIPLKPVFRAADESKVPHQALSLRIAPSHFFLTGKHTEMLYEEFLWSCECINGHHVCYTTYTC